ncbi:MAG: hypothetical protein WD766_11225 [Gemmatimonadota bacterium]
MIEWLAISAAWLIGSFGSAALLALLYRRLHPELSFHKLWVFWTVVVSLLALLILGTGLI